MKKYLLVLMVVVLSLSAQSTVPQLDSPQQVYTGDLHFMSITVTGNYFSNFTIANIIQLLSGMSKAGHTSGVSGNWWNMGWADQTDYNNAMADLIKELKAYYNSFPASSEVLSASLNNGQTVYATQFGEIVGGDAKSNVSVQQDYGQGGGVVTVNGVDYDADDIDTKDNTKEQEIRLSTNPTATLHTEYTYNGQKITAEEYQAYKSQYEAAKEAYEAALTAQTSTAKELQELQAALTSAEAKFTEVEVATKAYETAKAEAEAAASALANAEALANKKAEEATVAQKALNDAETLANEKAAEATAAQQALNDAETLANEKAAEATAAQQALNDAETLANEKAAEATAAQQALDSMDENSESYAEAKERAENAKAEAEAATQALNEAQEAKEAKDTAAQEAQTALTNAQNDKEAKDTAAQEANDALDTATKAAQDATKAAQDATKAAQDALETKEAKDTVANNAKSTLDSKEMTLEEAKAAKEDAKTDAATAKTNNDAALETLNTASDLQNSTKTQVEQWEKNEYNTYSAQDKNGNTVATDKYGYQINEDGTRATETVKDGTQNVYVKDENGEWKLLTVLTETQTKVNKANINAGSNSYVDNATGKTVYMSNVLSNSVTKYETDASKVSEATSAQKDLYTAEMETENTSTQTLTFYAGRNSTSYVNNGAWDLGSNASVTKDKAKSVLTIKTSSGKTYNIQAYSTTTPLVLDMDGDGKLEASKGEHLPHNLTTDPANMVNFDINGDGFDELVEWVGPNDGLLVRYTEGEEMTGLNLFGSATGFQDGYQSLSVLDANKDNVISGAELEGLSVWQDANGNAKVDAGEIKTVQALGITAINVTHIGLKSSFQRNGKYATMWDWHPCTIVVRKMD